MECLLILLRIRRTDRRDESASDVTRIMGKEITDTRVMPTRTGTPPTMTAGSARSRRSPKVTEVLPLPTSDSARR